MAGGRRRRITASAIAATAPRRARTIKVPPKLPNRAVNEKGSANLTYPAPEVQKDQPTTPIAEPAMNPTSVMTTPRCPEPVAKRVPEAQEPPSCIPIPNRAAPRNKAKVIGATKPPGVVPKNPAPPEMTTLNKTTAIANITVCACNARPCPTETSWRHAEVNPKREWNKVTPRASPMRPKVAFAAPWETARYPTKATDAAVPMPTARV